jgi:lycopene beta-cyclase
MIFESRIRNGNKRYIFSWDYQLLHNRKEQGSINDLLPVLEKKTHKKLNIGTAGGWTKASTGYTFKNSDKYSTQLVKFLEQGRNLKNFTIKLNFGIDLLLDILDRKTN